MPLRAYLVSLTLATLLPVAIFAGIVGYFLVEEQRETFRRGAEERTLAVLTAVDTELRASISTLNALATLPALDQGDLATLRDRAQRVLATQPGWQNVNLALPGGQQVMNLQVPDGTSLPDIGELDGSFAQLRQTLKPVVSDLAVGSVLRGWSFAVRVPVVRDGALKYVLSAGVKSDSISAVIMAQGLPENWVGVVVDRNGRIVARNLDPGGSAGKMASDSLREGLGRSPSGWFRGSTIEGTPVYTPYWRSETSGWAFAMGIPASAVDAAAWRGIGLLAAGLLGAVGLAIWLARVVGGRIATPIAELAKASEALGRGEAARVPETARVDEVRLLARSFQGAIGALRASEERMRSVVDNVVDGIISIDERGAMQTFNPAAERIFGYAAAEVVGQNVKMLMPEPYLRDHDDYIVNYVRTGQAKIIGIGREVEGRRKDGSTFPLDLAVSVFYIGSRRYFTGVVRDITERKRAEQALKDADRAKDEFLATMSHELRNPLAALTTAAHVLKVTDPSREAAIKARAVIERQTKHMARLIADLLDIGRVSAGKLSLEREPLDLAEVVGGLLQVWRVSGRFERHRIQPELAPVWIHADRTRVEQIAWIQPELAPVWIHADRTRVEQIAANLLDNALKFTPAGKTIAVSVRAEGDQAVLCVSDQGVGLEPGERERVFDLFVQGGHGTAGMGIGLALVKRLVELQGGTVAAASEGAERGAVFTVRLPAVPRPQEQPAAAPAQRGGARSVLIVEDNDDARQMLQAALKLGGHEVRAAPDGESALALAAESSPDVALIDLGLPGISGYEVARRLRAADGRRMALIAISGYGQTADRRRALEAGFDAHLTKPVTPERLQQTIGGLAER